MVELKHRFNGYIVAWEFEKLTRAHRLGCRWRPVWANLLRYKSNSGTVICICRKQGKKWKSQLLKHLWSLWCVWADCFWRRKRSTSGRTWRIWWFNSSTFTRVKGAFVLILHPGPQAVGYELKHMLHGFESLQPSARIWKSLNRAAEVTLTGDRGDSIF